MKTNLASLPPVSPSMQTAPASYGDLIADECIPFYCDGPDLYPLCMRCRVEEAAPGSMCCASCLPVEVMQ